MGFFYGVNLNTKRALKKFKALLFVFAQGIAAEILLLSCPGFRPGQDSKRLQRIARSRCNDSESADVPK